MKALIALMIALSPLSALAERCPIPASQEEREILLTDGPVYLESGYASFCLAMIIRRERQILRSQDMNDRDFVSMLMSAAMKADIFERDQVY